MKGSAILCSILFIILLSIAFDFSNAESFLKATNRANVTSSFKTFLDSPFNQGGDVNILNAVNTKVLNLPNALKPDNLKHRKRSGNTKHKLAFDRNALKEHLNSCSAPSKSNRSKENILGKNCFEVEIHAIVDRELRSAIQDNGEATDLPTYLSIFFNAVNAIYSRSHAQDSDFPQIIFRLVEISALSSSIENQIFAPIKEDADIINIETVLKTFKKYAIAKKPKYDKYDHIVLLTGRDLQRKVETGYDSDVLGVAYLKGACTKSTDERFEAFSVVEDIGGHFLGVYAAVHEFAHNMGVKHDAKKINCHVHDGYIMSPQNLRTDPKMFQFSECSLKALEEFLISTEGSCLSESNLKPVKPEENRLPGEVFGMYDLCTYFGNSQFGNEVSVNSIVNLDNDDDSLCRQISCKYKISGSNKPYIINPLYSPGEKAKCPRSEKVCMSGECV